MTVETILNNTTPTETVGNLSDVDPIVQTLQPLGSIGQQFRIRIGGPGGEVCKVTGGAGTAFLNVNRGQSGTTAQAWPSGSRVDIALTAESLYDAFVPVGGSSPHSFVGTTVPGSQTAPNLNNFIAKRVVLSSDSHVVSAAFYGQFDDGQSFTIFGAVLADISGSPGELLMSTAVTDALGLSNGNPRWMEAPMGIWLPAATYWICVHPFISSGSVNYEPGGSDVSAPTFGDYNATGMSPWVDSTNNYSIRASILKA